MKILVCKECGGTRFARQENYAVCCGCRKKYSAEELRQLIVVVDDGNAAEKIKKCPKCGAQISSTDKYCSKCASPLPSPLKTVSRTNPAGLTAPNRSNAASTNLVLKNSQQNQDFLHRFWNHLDQFGKLLFIVSCISVLLTIIGICTGKAWPIVCSCIQLVGIAYSAMAHKNVIPVSKKWLPSVVLAGAALLCVVNIASYSLGNRAFSGEKSPVVYQICTPCSAEDCRSSKNDELVSRFESAGFSNISTAALDDLELSEYEKDGLVESVTINSVPSFAANEEFLNTSEVCITYHSYKKVRVPISADEARLSDPDTIAALYRDAGFVNILTHETNDLDPDLSDADNEIEVIVDGLNKYDNESLFPLNAEVEIVVHRFFEKFKLKILIDFIPNLLFDKYDVDMFFENQKFELTHGQDAELEFGVKPGKYYLLFSKAESLSNPEMIEIEILDDTVASYQLSCESDKINLKTLYIEDHGTLGEGEAMVPLSAADCRSMNYKDVEAQFRNAGFTNITTEILYDIVWGWTSEGEVENVAINGESSFSKGTALSTDSPILITYHLSASDDPSHAVTAAAETEEQVEPEPLTIDNCDDLANIIGLEWEIYQDEISSFAVKHKGEIMELDMVTALVMPYQNYNTRFQYALWPIINGSIMINQPAFMFKDVNYYDLHLTGENVPDTFGVGLTCHVKAEILGYEDQFIVLDPIEISNIQKDTGNLTLDAGEYETGDSGIYAYVLHCKFYDIYRIINFDEGVVYYFTDGIDDSTADRIHITSGNLCDGLYYTYHDYADIRTELLYFKDPYHSDILIHHDSNGFDTEYQATDVTAALEILSQKTIKDY